MTGQEIREEYSKTFDKGLFNHSVRMWFYLQRGLDLINQFKYLVAGIIAFYYTLKLTNVYWIAVIFLISLPILVVVGWFQTHKMARVMEWTSMIFGSYFGRYGMDLSEKNVEFTQKNHDLLVEIRDLLKNK
jgi:hypothetical protein